METTSSHEIAKRVGCAMAAADWTTVLDAVTPDVIAHIPTVGDLEGIDALIEFLAETSAKTDGGEHLELLDALAGTDHIALYFRVTAERAGREPLDNLTVHLARLDGDRIAEIWFHNFDSATVAAFWS